MKPDYEKRKAFANWFLSIDVLEKIFFASDEAYFHLNGAVNNHNCRVWSDSGPDFVLEQPLYPEKNLVWCAVSSKKVIGPCFFDASVKHDKSPDFNPCDYFLWGYLKDKVYLKIDSTAQKSV